MIALVFSCLALFISLAALSLVLLHNRDTGRLQREHDGIVMPHVRNGTPPPSVPHRSYRDEQEREEPLVAPAMPEWLFRRLTDQQGDPS